MKTIKSLIYRGLRMEILIFIGILLLWFALQKYILPKFGIPT